MAREIAEEVVAAGEMVEEAAGGVAVGIVAMAEATEVVGAVEAAEAMEAAVAEKGVQWKLRKK